MTIQLSSRVKKIKPSPTLALAAKARELKAQGIDVIDLSVGEPDFPTPANVKEIAIKAIQENFTKYTAVDGIANLKQAIADKFKRENNLQYSLNQILVSCGAKHSIYNILQALIDAGDEVIIPAPYWVSYPDMVLLADGKPVFIATDIKQNFKITPQQLSKAITKATKAIIINSPSNPTGMSYTKQELMALAEIIKKHPQIIVISDDIYEHTLWNNLPFANILNTCPELYERCVVVNGVSKAYSMTGWRIGYAAGPAPLIAAMKNIQSQSTSNPTSIAQMATQEALSGSQECIKEMTVAFKQRHDFVTEELNKIPGVKAIPTDGTFYSFPFMGEVITKLKCKDDVELSELFLNKSQVAVVPGSAFGAPNYMRLSYATSMSLLRDALSRIKKLVSGT
jgi:aspartate aminotransferase